jgi:membrane protease subunit (stomatin/prohibitin family)
MTERQLPPAAHFSVFRSPTQENVERTEAEASANDGSIASPMPGLDWGLVLSVTMMRTLEYRLPGFTADVQKRLQQNVGRMESSPDSQQNADAASVHNLLNSWVFTEVGGLARAHDGDLAMSV